MSGILFPSSKQQSYSTPPAPEPTPESVAPPNDTERDKLKLARNGYLSKRTDLSATAVAATGTSGTGLNVPV